MTLAENQYNLDRANQISCGKGNILRRLVGLTRLHTDRQLLSLFKVTAELSHVVQDAYTAIWPHGGCAYVLQ